MEDVSSTVGVGLGSGLVGVIMINVVVILILKVNLQNVMVLSVLGMIKNGKTEL